MSWAHVQGTGASNATGTTGVTTLSATFANPVTAGNLIVVGLGSYGGGVTTFKDSINSTNYTQAVLLGTSSNQCGIWWYVAPVGGSSFQVTLTSTSASFPGITIDEFSFTHGATISTDAAESNVSSGTPSLTAQTPTGTDLAIAVVSSSGQSNAYVAGTNYSLTPFQGLYVANKAEPIYTEYSLNRSTAITPAFVGNYGGYSMAAALILPTGGGLVTSTGATLLACS